MGGSAVGSSSSVGETLHHRESGPDRRARDAIAIFEAAWGGCPDRVLLVDADRWVIIAANPAVRDEVLASHGIDMVGMPVGQLSPAHDDPDEIREKWRSEPGVDDTVRPHAFDPDRFVRSQTWAMAGFDGRFLISVARDIDLGLAQRDTIDKARPLLDVSSNLVAVVSQGAFRYRNHRFVDQFGSIESLDALIAQYIHPDDRSLCCESIDAAESGDPGRPIPVSMSDTAGCDRVDHAAGVWTRAEWVVAPAPGFDDGGLLLVIGALDPVAQVDLPDALSSRERQIVELLLQGLRVPTIAKALYLSPHTVRNHLRTIFAKCEVGSQRELVEKLRGGHAVARDDQGSASEAR